MTAYKRSVRKYPIATKEIPPIGHNVELTIWDSPIGNYNIELQDWQVYALQQILGLYTDFNDGSIRAFSKSVVEKRLNKIGRLSIVVDGTIDNE